MSESHDNHYNHAELAPHVQSEQEELRFSFCKDKIEESGEDAVPFLSAQKNKTGLISVFDGLGGSGSTKYQDETRTRTGAWLASRESNEALKKFYNRQTPTFVVTADLVMQLKQELVQHLETKFGAVHAVESALQSRMLKVFPTTIASVFYTATSQHCTVDVVWAGDSRIYCLTAHGLQQLTRDDVEPSNSTSLVTMMRDAPITNCVQARAPFTLHHHQYTLSLPCFLFAMTDGCYGYVESPMHLEYRLLNALCNSSTIGEWGDSVNNMLQTVAQDDYSMGTVCLGWNTFADVRHTMRSRYQELQDYLAPMQQLIEPMHHTNNSSNKDETRMYQRQQRLEDMWQRYRSHYFAKLEEHNHA